MKIVTNVATLYNPTLLWKWKPGNADSRNHSVRSINVIVTDWSNKKKRAVVSIETLLNLDLSSNGRLHAYIGLPTHRMTPTPELKIDLNPLRFLI